MVSARDRVTAGVGFFQYVQVSLGQFPWTQRIHRTLTVRCSSLGDLARATVRVDMYMHVNGGAVMKALIDGVDLSGTGTCAAFNLRRATRVVTQLYDAGLAETGARSTQFTILVALAKTQPASVGALAATTLMDQSTMTRNLRLLARMGLVDVPARGAKREKLVRLTAKGERVLVKAVPVWRVPHERFVDTF